MVTLFQFPSSWSPMPNPSPFCTKVEVFLRMAGVEYQVAPWSPMKAPLGKAPVIELEGELIADSGCILRRLVEHFELDLDDHLTAQQHAVGHLVRRTLEEHSYWGLLYIRWIEDGGWCTYRSVIGESVPALARPLMLPYLRRGVKQGAHAHGLSRHGREEVVRRVVADVDAITEMMGEHPFLLGDTPTTYDATAWSFLAHLAVDEMPHPLVDAVHSNARALAYVERGHALWGGPRE